MGSQNTFWDKLEKNLILKKKWVIPAFPFLSGNFKNTFLKLPD
jgi:hypothetical protein